METIPGSSLPTIYPSSPPRVLKRFFDRLAAGDQTLSRTMLFLHVEGEAVRLRIHCVPGPNKVIAGDGLPGETLTVAEIRQGLLLGRRR